MKLGSVEEFIVLVFFSFGIVLFLYFCVIFFLFYYCFCIIYSVVCIGLMFDVGYVCKFFNMRKFNL